jgi:hypothetical protein
MALQNISGQLAQRALIPPSDLDGIEDWGGAVVQVDLVAQGDNGDAQVLELDQQVDHLRAEGEKE